MANATPIRFLSGVYVYITSITDSFDAHGTLMRFFPSVYKIIVLQIAFLAERFVTDAALVRFLSSVHTIILLQSSQCK